MGLRVNFDVIPNLKNGDKTIASGIKREQGERALNGREKENEILNYLQLKNSRFRSTTIL
jgi:hypothetical protein